MDVGGADTTELFEAITGNQIAVVNEQLKAGISVNCVDDEGFTPLMVASSRGYAPILSVFIVAGADVNAQVKTDDPGTPGGSGIPNEQDAARGRSPSMSFSQLESEQEGQTALHMAADNGREHIAKLLLLAGADVSIKDDGGYTPEQCAEDSEQDDLVDLLQKWVTDPVACRKDLEQEVTLSAASSSAAVEAEKIKVEVEEMVAASIGEVKDSVATLKEQLNAVSKTLQTESSDRKAAGEAAEKASGAAAAKGKTEIMAEVEAMVDLKLQPLMRDIDGIKAKLAHMQQKQAATDATVMGQMEMIRTLIGK